MFNEFMSGAVDFLNMKNENYIKRDGNTEIGMFLSFKYDIPVDSILYIKEIKLDKITPIVLVWVDNENAGVRDYTFYKGELAKVVTYNRNNYEASMQNKIATVLTVYGDINNTIIEYYRGFLDDSIMATKSFLDILTYSPFIMSMSYITNFLPFIEDKIIYSVLSIMYPKIKEESIISAKKLVTDLPIYTLFDTGAWYGVSNQEYTAVRFFEIQDTKTMSWEWDDDDMEENNEEELINNETYNTTEE